MLIANISPEPTNVTNFWKIYINSLYYCLLIPFRLKYKSSNSEEKLVRITLETNKGQKVLFYIVFITVMVCAGLILRFEAWYDPTAPGEGLLVAMNTLDNISMLTRLITVVWLASIGIYALVVYTKCFDLNYWTFQSVARHKYDEINAIVPTSISVSLRPMLLVISLIGEFFGQGLEFSVDLFSFLTIALYCELVNNFLKSVPLLISADKIIQEFNHFKKVVKLINEVVGPSLNVLLIAGLPFYVPPVANVLLGTKFKPSHGRREIRITVYLCVMLCHIFMAARSAKKVEQVKELVAEDKMYLSRHCAEIQLLLQTLNNHEIALGNSFFQLIYGFLGTLIAAIFTYSVVVSQFVPK